MMFIQLDQKTRKSKGVVHIELPAEFWLSPTKAVPLTSDNAEQFGFINVEVWVKARVQDWLNATAASRGYDDILSACSYAATSNPFQAESLAFITMRADVWAYCFGESAKIQAGQRGVPSEDEMIAELEPFKAVLP